jgi:hypothetical protein
MNLIGTAFILRTNAFNVAAVEIEAELNLSRNNFKLIC